MNSWIVSLGILLFAIGILFLYVGLTAYPMIILTIDVLFVIIGIVLIFWGMASKKNKKSLNKKFLLLIALVIVASILIPHFLLTLFSVKYEKAIIRNTSNVEEANALTIAENSNYSDIFNLQRFTTGNPNETWPYTWANFIDTQVIEYYDDRFERLKGKTRSIKFRYEANVFTWDQIRVVYVAPEGGNIYDDVIQILSPNGSVLFENAQYTGLRWGMLFAYRNDSEYQEIMAEEINFSLSKSYVVEMILRYDETYAPLAAFTVDVYQIIIVNQDFIPFLFCVQSQQYIS